MSRRPPPGRARRCWLTPRPPRRKGTTHASHGAADPALAEFCTPGNGRNSAGGGDPHARPAVAGLRELDAEGTGRRAPGSPGRRDRAAAGAGDVRDGRPATPGPAALPRLPGAEPDLHRRLLAELRLGRPRGTGIRVGGRVPAGCGPAEADLRQVAGPRASAASRGDAGPDQGRWRSLLPALLRRSRAAAPRRERPGGTAERAFRDDAAAGGDR